MKKTLLLVTLSLLLLSSVAEAVMPMPSWDLEVIGRQKRPKKGNAILDETWDRYLDRPITCVEGAEVIDSYLSYGAFIPPIATWAALADSAKSDKALRDAWNAAKPRVAAELEFLLSLVSSDEGLTQLSGPGSKVTELYLEDDRGRRLQALNAAWKYSTPVLLSIQAVVDETESESGEQADSSLGLPLLESGITPDAASGAETSVAVDVAVQGDPEGEPHEIISTYGFRSRNTVTFPSRAEDGTPFINPETRFVRLWVGSAEGKVGFTYTFREEPVSSGI